MALPERQIELPDIFQYTFVHLTPSRHDSSHVQNVSKCVTPARTSQSLAMPVTVMDLPASIAAFFTLSLAVSIIWGNSGLVENAHLEDPM
ncbi:MAG: hypothetical protein OXH03_06835 [Bacteroidetes bacterium]|nr:hypothetical protein [Bacteroidota bacterium]MDE2672085.1 hypothetical protein [Bacteroidota bacterium]